MMLKLIAYPLTACLVFPSAGCAPTPVVPLTEGALFCAVEEPRQFTQEELDWRAENAPWNLRRDFKTNLAWERECPTTGA